MTCRICYVSKTQNIKRLQGRQFIYHLQGNSRLTYCGKLVSARTITYTDLHDANGIATMCADCKRDDA